MYTRKLGAAVARDAKSARKILHIISLSDKWGVFSHTRIKSIKSFSISRDDKIRTCDPTPPRRVRYRAALHPENIYLITGSQRGMAKVIEIFNFKKNNIM